MEVQGQTGQRAIEEHYNVSETGDEAVHNKLVCFK